ncbi:FACT complex subunit SPT16-like isoform X2 [Rutidosis leptorrhynchoides]|uniref:FACT complex subunit SPT16-like isoform X2 n=1 Tax=Rutidosis leptorrhynchoides TaxID=125765 RepID=UPI003A992885
MAAGGGNNAIDANTLVRRLKALYSHWREQRDELWGSCNAFAVATPPESQNIRYLKSSSLNIWLLGTEFPETIMFFSDKKIHFLCSQKKPSLLFDVVKKSAKEAVGVDVVMHVKAKNDGGSTQMDSILRTVESLDSPVLGVIAREAPDGELLEKWAEKLKSSGLQLNDISNGLAHLFAVKEAGELTNVKNAAYLTASVMKLFVVPKLEKVIDEETKVTHSSLMDYTERTILKPPIKIKAKLKAGGNVDICYLPIFQSGGKFDLKPSASSNDDLLYYNNYCANLARTFLIDSNAAQSKAYQVLLKAHEAALGALKPGNKACLVYKAALAVIEKEAPELTANLTKSAGTGIGLEFRESGLTLNEKNDRVLKTCMVLNVSLRFQNLQTKSSKAKSQNYALLLADTVIITADGHQVVTALSTKSFKDVAYSFNDGEQQLSDEKAPMRVVESKRNELLLYSKATTLRSSDNHEMSCKEERRRQHQAKLARQKNDETAQRLAGGGSISSAIGDGRSSSRTSNDLIAYKNVNDLLPPTRDRKLMIVVDQRNESILIPLYGCMVPFHISTVKTVSSQSDTSVNCYIRIIFNVPGAPFSSKSVVKNQQTDIFLKEVSFRSKDSSHISEVVQQIKRLRRNVSSRESEKAERASLVTQEKLRVLAAGNNNNKFIKPMRLTDVWIRPPFAGRGRKLPGTIEAHDNGFRYGTSRNDERVDILFSNIKHAFFQSAEKEMITLIHFHLYNHIMVGDKKTKDVQFYVEVMDVAQTLGGGSSKRSAAAYYDPEEIEEEQRERDRKNKMNMDFQNFVNLVNDLSKFKSLDLEFDQPLRELGFHGVPHKASAFIVPTSSCLVELIETPFFVVAPSEIEIVNLERVGLGQKNFDMAIVFKDFKCDVLRIDSIPCTSLDGIKEWLDTTDIKYYESRLNMNWRAILKTIIDDPKNFVDEGGWEFLNLEAASDSDSGEESDQGYEPSDVEPESESEDDDGSDSASLDDEEEDEEEGSEEEEGKTWEELEREATNADKEKGVEESDSEEERKRRKLKAFGKSRVGPSSSSGPKRPKFTRIQQRIRVPKLQN